VVEQLLSKEAATLAVNDVFYMCSHLFISADPGALAAATALRQCGRGPGH
jgi:DHA2 family multidrug resistance protein